MTTTCRSIFASSLAAILGCGLPLVVPAAVLGASGANSANIAAGTTIGMEGYFRMIWGLLVVLGVILLLYGLLKKRFSILASSEGKNIKVTEMKPLGSRKLLCLVEVKGEEFLLGISGDNITHLATLSGGVKDKISTQNFQSVLQKAENEAER